MEGSGGSIHEADPRVIGLVAGAGQLPIEAARVLRAQGYAVRALAFSGIADERLLDEVEAHTWIQLGQLAEARLALRQFEAEAVLLVGKVPKAVLRGEEGLFVPDAEALSLLGSLGKASDDSLLGVVGRWLEENQIRVERQDHVLADLLAGSGPLSTRRATAQEEANGLAAQASLSVLGREGSGQCVVMAEGRVIAREEEAGTDDAIRRAGAVAAPLKTVVKAARPDQDRRFDLPAVGPDTLRAMREAGATGLAVEAGSTLIIDRDAFRREADAAGIAVWGFSAAEAEA